MSSVRSVELVVVPPPHAASTVASSVSAADQTPSRLPGFLNGLPPQEISSDLLVAPRASVSPWRSDRPRAESLVRASPNGPQRVDPRGLRPLQDGHPALGVEEMESRRIQCKLDTLLRPDAGPRREARGDRLACA